MFWCLPPSGKCEWKNIKPFADFINNSFNTSYELEKCLDVTTRNTPQPEVQLLDKNLGKHIVIERKNLIWPTDHVKYHQGEHMFMDEFIGKAKTLFIEGTYLLRLKSRLFGSKRKINRATECIVKEIQSRNKQLLYEGKINSFTPFPWSFLKLDDSEKDTYENVDGVGVELVEDDIFNAKIHNNDMEEIISILNRHLKSTARKFLDYSDNLRVLMLSVYAEIITEDNLDYIIKSASIPQEIDHIWVEVPEWTSEKDWEIKYKIFYGSEEDFI